MKNTYLTILMALSLSISGFAQQTYYNDVDLTLTGTALRDELATKVINTHTNFISYTQLWEASRVTDLDPNDPTNTNIHTANTYAQGNRKFADGTGNSGTVGADWYPGDATAGGTDWRGDVARMMMYTYIRYGNQCLPSNVVTGTTNAVDSNMINLLLDWNAADPVSQLEIQRNTYHENTANTYAQGNRNPFIDEPYLATLIWGGTPAQDIWGIFGGSNDTEAPTVPTNLVASNPTSSTVDLAWTASTDNTAVTSYDVYVNGSLEATV